MHHAGKYPAVILLGLLLSGSFSGMASETAPAVTTAAVHRAWLKNAVARLSAMPDTDALVTAGALAHALPDGQARSLELLDRAVASAPQATDIGLLDIGACNGNAGCDALKREARLRRADPRNGSLWMVALHDASKRADRPRIDTVLSRMAQSDRFDLHFMSLGQRFLVALKRVPPPPATPTASADVLRQLQALSMVAAFAMPRMQDLVAACKPGHPASDARRKTCRAIAGSLRRSDSLIANMIGLRLQEWNARDAADRDDALAQRRRLQWKMQQLRNVSGTPGMPPASQVGIMLAHENEVDGVDAMLRAAGRPLDPPSHWQPVVPTAPMAVRALP